MIKRQPYDRCGKPAIHLHSNSDQDSVRQRFTGYQKDSETKLDFAEARMYQNLHGRFTAVDPLLASGKSANPQTFNRYVYVMNSPLVLTDPSGLQAASQSTGKYYKPDRPGPGDDFLHPKLIENPRLVPDGWTLLPDMWWNAQSQRIDSQPGVRPERNEDFGTDLDKANKFAESFMTDYFAAQWKSISNTVVDCGNLSLRGNAVLQGGNPLFSPQIPNVPYSNTTQKVLGFVDELVLGAALSAGANSALKGVSFGNRFLSPTSKLATSGDETIAVIGRLEDTRNLAGLKNADVLLRPNNMWNQGLNNNWLNSVTQRRIPVYLASPVIDRNLYTNAGRLTQFGTEVQACTQAGYTRWGNWYVPF